MEEPTACSDMYQTGRTLANKISWVTLGSAVHLKDHTFTKAAGTAKSHNPYKR